MERAGRDRMTAGGFAGFEMWASSLENVTIVEPGALDPLSLPAQPIASLDQFHPRETLQHRVNVAGIVTYVDSVGSNNSFSSRTRTPE